MLCLKLNDETIASGSWDNTIKIWNVKNGSLMITLVDHTNWVTGLIKLNDSFMLSGSYDSTMKIWSTLDWTVKKTINVTQPITLLLLLNDEKIAVGNDGDYKISIFHINSDVVIFEMAGHTSLINSFIQLNITHIISGSDDFTIKLWDINKGTLSATLYTFSVNVWSLVNLNNGLIAVGLYDFRNNLVLIETHDWKIHSYLNGHTSIVYSLQLLSDRRLASGSEDKTAIIWNSLI